MLKQRLITGALLIFAFVAALFLASSAAFCLLTEVVVLFAAWEWSRLMGLTQLNKRSYYTLFIFFVLQGSFFLPVPVILALALVFWLLMLPLVLYYPRAQYWKTSILNQGLMGLFVLIPTWLAINFLRNVDHGEYLLLFFFILIWGADSGAYFVGRKWGKTLLLARVSPGKTREGLYAALVFSLLIAAVPLVWFSVPFPLWIYCFVLALLTVLFSVLGDLFESMLKRSENLNDSGKIFPGHGGLLDRIDSLTAAAPIFALGAIVLSKIG